MVLWGYLNPEQVIEISAKILYIFAKFFSNFLEITQAIIPAKI